MESGLECEGEVEGTMNVMALREDRDGVVQWQPRCTSCLATFPRRADSELQYYFLPVVGPTPSPAFFLFPPAFCDFPSSHLLRGSSYIR
jgi:hypothetical protein